MDLWVRKRAQEHFEAARELAASIGSQHWMSITNADYARCLVRFGDLDAAESILNERMRPDLPMISLGHRGVWLAHAELLLARGDVEQALEIIDQLGSSARQIGMKWPDAIPYLALLRGQAELRAGRLDAAASDFGSSLTMSRRLGLKPLTWLALVGDAERASAAEQHDEARILAAEALAVAEEMAATVADAAVRHMYLISEPVERLRQRAQAGAF